MEFVDETTADHKSPITSTFVSRMNNMRQTISTLEEVSLGNSPTLGPDPSSDGKYLLNGSAINIQLRLRLATLTQSTVSLSEWWMSDDWKVYFRPRLLFIIFIPLYLGFPINPRENAANDTTALKFPRPR